MQPSSFGLSVEQPTDTPVEAPKRRATSGAPRSTRHDRAADRRVTLSSLAAELSAAAATIEGAPPAMPAATPVVAEPRAQVQPPAQAVLDRLAALDSDDEREDDLVVPLRPQHQASVEVVLTGRRDAIPPWEGGPVPAAPAGVAAVVPEPVAPAAMVAAMPAAPSALAPEAPAAAMPAATGQHLDATELRALVQLEAARAEADVLSTRIQSEHAARAEAERRLLEAEEELRFLRAEVQMTGHEHRRKPGRLRRTLRTLTGRGRPVVPANNPKKERLGI